MRFLILSIFFIYSFANQNIMLLKKYKDQNITGWVMSEKLDGIRGYWDGKKMISKNGKIINTPKWFIKNYPPFAIDGELWSKRGDFENISSIVRDKIPSKKWHQIKHYIFDVPDAKGNLFNRLNKLKLYLKTHPNTPIKIIPQIKIKNKQEVFNFLKEIEKKEGEGVVIRNPNAPYERKKSNQILKLKTFLDDECKVIGYTKGKGKYQNLIGAIKCKLRNGIIFKIGSGLKLKDRKNPPQIGDIITFKYKELTKNKKPRFPVFLRIRYKRNENVSNW